jgi:hypothetical protein
MTSEKERADDGGGELREAEDRRDEESLLVQSPENARWDAEKMLRHGVDSSKTESPMKIAIKQKPTVYPGAAQKSYERRGCGT